MKVVKFIVEGPKLILREAGDIDLLILVQRLTLLTLLLTQIGGWYFNTIILLIAACGLLFRKILQSPLLWFTLSLLIALKILAHWHYSPNHHYLLSYWCLAIAVSLVVDDTRASLSLNGKLLIGLVFALATVQKVLLSTDFMDSRFFRLALTVDNRYEVMSLLVGGLNDENLESNREFVEADLHGTYASEGTEFFEPTAFRVLAQTLTWYTVILEAVIAICFLWPSRHWISRQKHKMLMLFCVTIYSIATVAGFGWLLVIMGLAQTDEKDRYTRWAYLLTYALILFYREVPWAEILVDWRST